MTLVARSWVYHGVDEFRFDSELCFKFKFVDAYIRVAGSVLA